MSLGEINGLRDPDESGRFGEFGGRFVPETLIPACLDLEKSFKEAWADKEFRSRLDQLLSEYDTQRR